MREIVLKRVRLDSHSNLGRGRIYFFADTGLKTRDNIRYIVRVFEDGEIHGVSYHKKEISGSKAVLSKGFIDLLKMVMFPKIMGEHDDV